MGLKPIFEFLICTLGEKSLDIVLQFCFANSCILHWTQDVLQHVKEYVMNKKPAIYLLTNKPNGTLYTGVTSDLPKRVWQHKNRISKGFCTKYNLTKLVYFELFEDMYQDILYWRRLARRCATRNDGKVPKATVQVVRRTTAFRELALFSGTGVYSFLSLHSGVQMNRNICSKWRPVCRCTTSLKSSMPTMLCGKVSHDIFESMVWGMFPES